MWRGTAIWSDISTRQFPAAVMSSATNAAATSRTEHYCTRWPEKTTYWTVFQQSKYFLHFELLSQTMNCSLRCLVYVDCRILKTFEMNGYKFIHPTWNMSPQIPCEMRVPSVTCSPIYCSKWHNSSSFLSTRSQIYITRITVTPGWRQFCIWYIISLS